MAERIKIKQLTDQIAELTEEIGRQKEIEQTKKKIIHNAITENRQRFKIKKHPEKTHWRRWQLLGRPHIDLRLPWTEVIPLVTKTEQPEQTPRCVIQGMNEFTTPKELEMAFAKYGTVQKTQTTHSENKRTVHFATVTFVNFQDASTAQKCIDGTSLHGRLLRVKQTNDVSEEKNKQVPTRTTSQMIRVNTKNWDKTDNLKELASQLRVAQTIPNGRREQSQPRSPDTPMSSRQSTPTKGRSRSRSGSSTPNSRHSNQERSTTISSTSKWVVTINQENTTNGPKEKDKEKPVAITRTTKRENKHRPVTTVEKEKPKSIPTKGEKEREKSEADKEQPNDRHTQRNERGRAAAGKADVEENLGHIKAKEKIRAKAKAAAAKRVVEKEKAKAATERKERKVKAEAAAAEKPEKEKAKAAAATKAKQQRSIEQNHRQVKMREEVRAKAKREDNAKKEKSATTTKMTIDRQDEGDHTPMPSGDDAEALPVLRESINEWGGVQEVKITNDNLESIAQESLRTVQSLEKSADLRAQRIRQLKARLKGNKPTHEEEESDVQDEPTSEGEFSLPMESDTEILHIQTDEHDMDFQHVAKGEPEGKPQNKASKTSKKLKEYQHKGDKQIQQIKNSQPNLDKDKDEEKPIYLLHDNLTRTTTTAPKIQWRMTPTPQEIQDLRILRQTTQHEDIKKIKDNVLYMKYAKSYHLKQIKRVRTPTADNCLTVKHWELKVERWKCELQVVVEEHNNRKKRSSEVADKTSSSVKQTKSPKPVWPIQQDNKPNPHKCSKGVKRSQMDCKSKYYNWNTSGRDRDYRQPSTQSKSRSDNRYRNTCKKRRSEQASPDAHHQDVSGSSAYKKKSNRPTRAKESLQNKNVGNEDNHPHQPTTPGEAPNQPPQASQLIARIIPQDIDNYPVLCPICPEISNKPKQKFSILQLKDHIKKTHPESLTGSPRATTANQKDTNKKIHHK